MQAISVPVPDAPPSVLSPVEDAGRDQRPPRRSARLAATAAMLIVAFTLGWVGRGDPAPVEYQAAPDLASTLGWMFDAALAHDGITVTGVEQGPAVGAVTVEQVEAVDPISGPLLVIATLDGAPTAFEVVVQRHGFDWSVQATRLSADGAAVLSPRGS